MIALMVDYVQYHNPARFAASCAEVAGNAFVVATNKRVRNLVGQQLWVICGEGKPRQYYLCKQYRIDEVVAGDDEDFRFLVRGVEGVRYQPPCALNHLPWFYAFRRSQSNFSFGLNPIHPDFVAALRQLVSP